MRALALSAAVLSASGGAAAQEATRFDLSGSVRLRYEAIQGQPRPGFNAADSIVNLRTRLLAEYRPDPALRLGAELFDSRVEGEDSGTPVSTSEVNALELAQAYAVLDLGSAELQLGRFMINVGSRRLVASDDFRNTTNSYTGLELDWRAGAGVEGAVFAVLPQTRLPDDPDGVRRARVAWDRESLDAQLYGAIVTAPALADGAALQASYVRFVERDAPDLATRDRRLDTIALRYFREPTPGRADFDFEAMFQRGAASLSAAQGVARADVDAWFVHAEIGRRFAGPLGLRLALEYDIASGDAPGADYERFDTLFGMRRAEIAPSGLYNTVGRANFQGPALRGEIMPSDRLEAALVWRPLWLHEPTDAFSSSGVRDPAGAAGDFAGHQFDLRARAWIAPERLRLDMTFVYLAKGRFLETAPNAPRNGDAVYVAIDLTTLF